MAGYRIFKGEDLPYFVTSSTVGWAHVFTSPRYFEILTDALTYCRDRKGLRVYGYVILTNHFHLIAQTEAPGALSGVMRDLKRHTSARILEQLAADGYQPLLGFFRDTPLRRLGNSEGKVWQDGFHPVALESEAWFLQKLEYIEQNPVRKGYVDEPEHWRYSSARNRIFGDHSALRIDSWEGDEA